MSDLRTVTDGGGLPPLILDFIREHVRHGRAILALDYDGTLAPFQVQRGQAVPTPRTRAALAAVARKGSTRLVVVSGRPVDEVDSLLHLEPRPDLWGAHGWERMRPDGSRDVFAAPARTLAALDAEEKRLHAVLEDERIERKSTSLAIHWRGLADDRARAIEAEVRAAWGRIAPDAGLTIRAFDGGVELRVPGRDKGTVIDDLLREEGPAIPILFIGDDATDEDAFRALLHAPHGLGVRAGTQAPTLARATIPVASVVDVLDAWAAHAASMPGATPGQ